MTRTVRSLTLVAATLAGMVIGITGGFVQAHRSVVFVGDASLVLPWGVVIVLTVLLIGIRAAATLTHLRAGAWLVLLGWLTSTLFLATETTSGDLAVSSGLRQWVYLLAGAVVGATVATLPPRALASAHREGAQRSVTEHEDSATR